MGVFARLLRRGGTSGEGQAAREQAPAAEPEAAPAGAAVTAPARPETGGEQEAAGAAGIPKQQSAEGAADSDAGDEARR
ncbi:hypothetical protein [Streptomyces sp. MAR4 CNX-425]|uniref:hypothetical protein n=1 Tax=Streptomyces sp. MAR4 CNX-425 TaxID=3406343 RepID=UPI003B511E0D